MSMNDGYRWGYTAYFKALARPTIGQSARGWDAAKAADQAGPEGWFTVYAMHRPLGCAWTPTPLLSLRATSRQTACLEARNLVRGLTGSLDAYRKDHDPFSLTGNIVPVG